MEIQSLSINLHDYRRHIMNDYADLAGQVASGERIIRSSIDPSGLAISKGMESRLRGIAVALQNTQDTRSMLKLADQTLGDVTGLVMRIRDLTVRMANSATSNTRSSGDPNVIIPSDQRKMYDEMCELAEEAKRVLGGLPIPNPPFVIEKGAVTYNQKDLFFSAFAAGQNAQIGPDSSSSLSIVIPSMTDITASISSPPVPLPGDFTAEDFKDYALIRLDEMDTDLEKLGNVRASIGTQTLELEKIINDMSQQMLSLAGAKSRLSDTDMAEAASGLKRNLIIQFTLSMAMVEIKNIMASGLVYLNVLPVSEGKG